MDSMTTQPAANEVLQPKRRRKRGIIFGIIALVLVIACVVVFLFQKETQSTISTYKESRVTRGDITAGISETGTVSIDYETVKYEISNSRMDDLGLSVSVQEVYVKSGQKVEAGDPLILISTTDLQEQLDNAQLNLRQAQASLTQAQLDQTLKKLDAESNYETNKILAESAEQTYENTLKSLEHSITQYENEVLDLNKQIKYIKSYCYGAGGGEYSSKHENPTKYTDEQLDEMSETAIKNVLEGLNDDLDVAETALEKAQLELETKQAQAKNQLDADTFTSENAKTLYEVELSQIENSLSSAELKVESAQNDVEQFSEYLANNGVITSPISGTIMTLGYSAGDELSSNNPIAIISNPAEAYISVSIVQEDITTLELGQKASITLDAFPDDVFTGALDSMSVQPSRSGGSTVSYTVDSRFDSPSDKFFEGMTGTVTFITNQLRDVLMVTNRAITNNNGVQTVKVKRDDGTIEEREITTGFSDGRNVEVTSGLEEGEVVLIESQVVSR